MAVLLGIHGAGDDMAVPLVATVSVAPVPLPVLTFAGVLACLIELEILVPSEFCLSQKLTIILNPMIYI